jgi:biopolymer transport protein ExbD
MIFKRHIELEKGQLDIAPLIDVVFLLLIFFMLTSSFISPQGIRVNLPSAVSSKFLPQEDFVISITEKGIVMIDGKKTSLKKLTAKVKVAAETDSRISIKADKETPLGKVVEIWDLCRDAGITNLNIATERKTK